MRGNVRKHNIYKFKKHFWLYFESLKTWRGKIKLLLSLPFFSLLLLSVIKSESNKLLEVNHLFPIIKKRCRSRINPL